MHVYVAAVGVLCVVYGLLHIIQLPIIAGKMTSPHSAWATGLGFLICGCALLFRWANRAGLSMVCGFVLEFFALFQLAFVALKLPGLYSGMGLLESVAVDLIAVGEPLSFLLAGIGFWILGYKAVFRYRSAFVAMFGATVLGYGVISLANSVAGIGDNLLGPSICFTAIGSYLLLAAWYDPTRAMNAFWFNGAIGTGSLIANVILWQGLVESVSGVGDPQAFATAVLLAGLLAVGCLTLATYYAQTADARARTLVEVNAGLRDEIVRRTAVEVSLDQQVRQLAALKRIDMSILTGDMEVSLGAVTKEAAHSLGAVSVAVHVLEKGARELRCVSVSGMDGIPPEGFSLAPKEVGVNALLKAADHTISRKLSEQPYFTQQGIPEVSYHAIPLISHRRLIGAMEVACLPEMVDMCDNMGFVDALAGQATIAIEHSLFFEAIKKSTAELLEAYDATLVGLAGALELRDQETQMHTMRVAEMSVLLAKRLGVPDEEIVHIRRGALLHDIGKIGIPDHILLKPGALADNERVIMNRHTEYAYDLLKSIPYLKLAMDIPRYHHERWDGKGYPEGLKGEEIPFAARMFAVVDVWDALSSDRPYRAAWSQDQVLEHVRELAGTHLDPKVVSAFLELLADEKEVMLHG